MYKEIIQSENIIFYNTYHIYEKEIDSLIHSDSFQRFINKLGNNHIIVIGGDGTMIYAIHKYIEQKKKFIGINYGNTGYLMKNKNILTENMNLQEGSYPTFEVFINNISLGFFINEINIQSDGGRPGEYELTIGNQENIQVKGDGLIVSSPLGSTAYNNSLGGPKLMHNSNTLCITPKALIYPKGLPSIVCHAHEIISIKTIGRKYGTRIFVDSLELDVKNGDIDIKIQHSRTNFFLYI